jgi:hypothetical protein
MTRKKITTTASLAAMLALCLTGCAPSSSQGPQDCEVDGTCDTPDMTANQTCDMLCDGFENEPEELGESDRLEEYTRVESSELVDRALAAIRPKRHIDDEGFPAQAYSQADYESLAEQELANFVCKTDCREQAAIGFCEERRHDAIEVTQTAFQRDFLRWACADVDGVTFTSSGDSRGQEYCEYFAVVQLPGMEQAVDLGRNIDGRGQMTDPSISWSLDQDFDMEDEELASNGVVGQCVFTTWHSDLGQPLPACADGSCDLTYEDTQTRAPWVTADTGLDLDADTMQMKVSFNSNGAAADLVEKCVANPITADDYGHSELDDLYVRGCMGAYSLFQTEWRRSDSEVCVVGTRIAECGCKIEVLDDEGAVTSTITDPVEVGKAVVPPQYNCNDDGDCFWNETVNLRGFQLGTWSGLDQLAPGCRVIDTGDTFPSGAKQRNIVACDIRTSNLRAMASAETSKDELGAEERLVAKDVKDFCKTKYGNDVVVHVPIPAPDSDFDYLPIPNARVTCDEACGQDPWVITRETE